MILNTIKKEKYIKVPLLCHCGFYISFNAVCGVDVDLKAFKDQSPDKWTYCLLNKKEANLNCRKSVVSNSRLTSCTNLQNLHVSRLILWLSIFFFFFDILTLLLLRTLFCVLRKQILCLHFQKIKYCSPK